MPDPAAPVIALAGFGFRHVGAERPALDDVTLEIRAGEYVGVLGATGAGVSTLLTALDGVVPQLVRGEAWGSITVAGRDPRVTPVHEMAGTVGLVFDDPGLAAGQPTVADEVAFGLENLGVPPGTMGPRIAAALDAVGLAGFEDRLPATLSGGELQRLAIAGAIASGSPVLVLDEPSANLDPVGRRAVYGILRHLNRDLGVTVVVSDQDAEALAADATRVVVLHAGRMVADDTPARVLGDPSALRRHGVRATDAAALGEALGVSVPVPTDASETARRLVVRRAGTPHPDGPPDAAAAPPLLDIREAGFRYPGSDRQAVAGVSLAVRPGEVVGLAGANGGGKTTLLRLANGLLRPQRGRVVVDGLDTSAHPVRTLAAHVASVFQDPAHQLFASTVAEELALGPRALGVPEAQVGERVREVAGLLELDAVLGRHPLRLGRAERKLVALGAVLAMRPRVLVLDEPTTGHDARLAGLVEARVRAAADEGAAVLVASHDMAFLGRVASRLVVMDAGRVLADDAARSVFADAALLASAGLEAPGVTRVALAVAASGPAGWPPVSLEEALGWLELADAGRVERAGTAP
jgi:energy-coupling factor transport system ATP-binding protein